MVGHRVSQAELYDDRDVIIQILKLKDTVNDYAGGIIDSIDIVGDDLVIDWADGTSVSLPLPSPTGISSVTGTVSGGNLIITFYMTDGSSHAFTTPLNGIATESYVDALDAENVKKTGSTVTGALEVPTTPPTPLSAVNDVYVNDASEGVNNLLHKSGNETKNGQFFISAGQGDFNFRLVTPSYTYDPNDPPSNNIYLSGLTFNGSEINNGIGGLRLVVATNGTTRIEALVKNSNGSNKWVTLASGDVI